jgi:voltage-gated potassium channel
VAVTVITIPITPPITALARFLRFARLVRLLPGLQSARRIFSLNGLRYAALVSVGLIVFGGLLFAEIEAGQDLDPSEGIWWAMTTVTTVGYGDIYPTTTGGRILATGLMILGIGFVALVTGFIAERFLAAERSDQETLASQLVEINAKLDQLQEQIARSQPPER